MNLFLDDHRQPEDVSLYCHSSFADFYRKTDWKVVRNYDDFVKFIEDNGLPEIISFDHDLADIHYDISTFKESFLYHEKTGYDCCRWLVDYCLANNLELPKCYIHSQSTVGSKRIQEEIESFQRKKEILKSIS